MSFYSVDDDDLDAHWERACDIVAERRPELDENCDEFDGMAQYELGKIEAQNEELVQASLFQ